MFAIVSIAIFSIFYEIYYLLNFEVCFKHDYNVNQISNLYSKDRRYEYAFKQNALSVIKRISYGLLRLGFTISLFFTQFYIFGIVNILVMFFVTYHSNKLTNQFTAELDKSLYFKFKKIVKPYTIFQILFYLSFLWVFLINFL